MTTAFTVAGRPSATHRVASTRVIVEAIVRLRTGVVLSNIRRSSSRDLVRSASNDVGGSTLMKINDRRIVYLCTPSAEHLSTRMPPSRRAGGRWISATDVLIKLMHCFVFP